MSDAMYGRVIYIDDNELFFYSIKYLEDRKGISIYVTPNDVKEYITLVAGMYTKYSHNSDLVEEAPASLNTAYAIIRGIEGKTITFIDDRKVYILKVKGLVIDQGEAHERWSATAPQVVKLNLYGEPKLIAYSFSVKEFKDMIAKQITIALDKAFS